MLIDNSIAIKQYPFAGIQTPASHTVTAYFALLNSGKVGYNPLVIAASKLTLPHVRHAVKSKAVAFSQWWAVTMGLCAQWPCGGHTSNIATSLPPKHLSSQTIDNDFSLRQDSPAGVNPPASFSRLVIHIGRLAANNSILSGVFMSAHQATIAPFFYGRQWQGGYMPTGLYASTANLAICLPPTRLAALSGLTRPYRKAISMPKIRQLLSFKQPIQTEKLYSFSSFDEACDMVDSLTTRNSDFYRFLIEQTANGWTVSRIIQGGAA